MPEEVPKTAEDYGLQDHDLPPEVKASSISAVDFSKMQLSKKASREDGREAWTIYIEGMLKIHGHSLYISDEEEEFNRKQEAAWDAPTESTFDGKPKEKSTFSICGKRRKSYIGGWNPT